MTIHVDFLDELRWRGLLHQCTDEDSIRQHLAGGVRRAYTGFDPTADSLTIGNLVPIMLLIHFARAGHEPIVVMGGGTGLIGDPSGKSAERQLMTEERVEAHVRAQRDIFVRAFAGAGLPEPPIVNNLDWLGSLGYLKALRDIGKHFSVNMMMQKDSVRERLHAREQGISYTEFSYMVLQAHDFAHLHRAQNVTMQIGGSDQWGNIVAGTELIRKVAAAEAADHQDSSADASAETQSFGLTAPLVTKADGTKFGKTESGAVWLSPHRTSPYAYYQFWMNASDDDAAKWLKVFTLLPRGEIEAVTQEHQREPGQRLAQRTLAEHATRLLHGEDALRSAQAVTQALFSGDVRTLDAAAFAQFIADMPSSVHDRIELEGEGMPVIDLLVSTELAESKKKAREFLQAGSVRLNGTPVGLDHRMTGADLIHGRYAALRRGKKTWHVTSWS